MRIISCVIEYKQIITYFLSSSTIRRSLVTLATILAAAMEKTRLSPFTTDRVCFVGMSEGILLPSMRAIVDWADSPTPISGLVEASNKT